jgi:hypothetical protein
VNGLKITKAPELTSADEELKKKTFCITKKNITMFYRVTCEIATPRKIIVDLGFASVNNDFSRGGLAFASVNNDFSRGGNFTCYPTKHVIFLYCLPDAEIGLTAGVTGRQGMLIPPRYLIPPLVFPGTRASLIFLWVIHLHALGTDFNCGFSVYRTVH